MSTWAILAVLGIVLLAGCVIPGLKQPIQKTEEWFGYESAPVRGPNFESILNSGDCESFCRNHCPLYTMDVGNEVRKLTYHSSRMYGETRIKHEVGDLPVIRLKMVIGGEPTLKNILEQITQQGICRETCNSQMLLPIKGWSFNTYATLLNCSAIDIEPKQETNDLTLTGIICESWGEYKVNVCECNCE